MSCLSDVNEVNEVNADLCSQNGTEIAFPGLSSASIKREHCHTCHSLCKLHLTKVHFETVGGGTEAKKSVSAVKAEKKKGEGVGALPRTGLCKHYRKSHRWLRFPCCDKAYPCDRCHEEENEDGHEMAWANRMICGYCGTEQHYSNKPCRCGRELTQGTTEHWEGGKGCRDKTKYKHALTCQP